MTAAADEPDEDGFFTGQDDRVQRQHLTDGPAPRDRSAGIPTPRRKPRGPGPAVIGIGHHDPLLAQDLAYATALRAAGVPVVLWEYPDLIHGFFGTGVVSVGAEHAAEQLSRDLRASVVGDEGAAVASGLRYAVTAK